MSETKLGTKHGRILRFLISVVIRKHLSFKRLDDGYLPFGKKCADILPFTLRQFSFAKGIVQLTPLAEERIEVLSLVQQDEILGSISFKNAIGRASQGF